jgi:hypothetical protein
MKKILSAVIILLVIGFAGQVWATGSCVLTSTQDITVNNQIQRKYITLTCTSDGSGIAAYSLNPATYNMRGWYLYNVTTDPDGTSAPTNNYDVTLLTSGGEDITNGTALLNRSSTVTQTALISDSTRGYHMMDSALAVTFSGITSNPGILVMTLRFTSN